MSWIKDISLFFVSVLISLFLCELILSFANPINLRSDPSGLRMDIPEVIMCLTLL